MYKAFHRRFSSLFPKVSTVFVAAMLAACGQTSPTPPPAPPAPPVVVRDQARVLDAAARSALQEVKPDGTLVFSSAAGAPGSGLKSQAVNPSQLQPGDVIVSEPTPAAPYGLLRKVTGTGPSITGTTAVTTIQAKIGDALKSGQLAVTDRALTADDLESVTPLAQGTIRRTDLGLTYALDVVLLDQDGNHNTTNDQIRATGSINLKPMFDFDLSLNCGPLCLYDNDLDFLFKLKLQEQTKLQIVGKVAYGASLEVSVFRLNFHPIVFFIGPIPVVITPRLTLKVRLDGSIGASIDFQATQTLTAVAGVQYTDAWHNLSSITNSFDTILANAALTMNATARAPLQAEFLLYGVVGPTIGVAAKLNLDAAVPRDPVWKLNGGIEGTVGIKVDVLGYTKEYSDTLFDLVREIGRAANTAPTIKFFYPTANANVDVNVCCDFSVQVRDAEDGVSCCAVTFSSSVDGPLGTGTGNQASVSKTLTTLGPRTITATAKDSKGTTATTSVTINAVNTPPTVAISAPFTGQQLYQGLAYTLHSSSYDLNETNAELPCASLSWTSSVGADPRVTGCAPQITFASQGARTLTLTGTDGFKATNTASVNVTVLPPPTNYPPVVNITKPTNNLLIGPDGVLQLAGTATDPEGGATTLEWDVTNNYDPTTGTGATTKTITLGAGGNWKPSDSFMYNGCPVIDTLRLRLRAKDPQNVEGSDFIVVRVITVC